MPEPVFTTPELEQYRRWAAPKTPQNLEGGRRAEVYIAIANKYATSNGLATRGFKPLRRRVH